ncbi:MAG: protein jag [Anaerolineales bacterium]|nr:protein jag [Anaerolineales bacterium]
MSEHRATLEKIAPTIEEAIAIGLAELGLSEDNVEIEVLDEGTRGLFGLGNRQARVRLTVKGDAPDTPAQANKAAMEVEESSEAEAPAESAPEPEYDEDDQNMIAVARETVAELLDKMGVKADVNANLGESDDPRFPPPVTVDITGNDLSILIGRRAETLNALQFITRLIVGKELGRGVHVIVDVEGYRMRRERSLRQLARRMASQAVRTGRRQVLEPMAANERRIIHMELRDDENVTTESIGEDPRRKVTITPKHG